MPRKSFALPSPEELGEPLEIEITYKERDAEGAYHERTQEFSCLPFLPASALRYVGLAANDTLAACAYIERCIATDEQADEFLELVNNRQVALRGEELGDIFQWLSSSYAGRPTGQQSASPSTPMPTGDGSTES